MKTDKLEQFVKNNRDSFDKLEPDLNRWKDIMKPASEAKTISFNIRNIVSRAAAVVLIFTASYYFHEFRSQQKASEQIANSENINSPLFNELMEAEYYYTAKIDERKDEFIKLTNNVPDLQKDMIGELNELDEIFLDLKEDLNENVDNQEVIEAMIQNYILKLEILEEMLHQIKIKHEKNNSNNENYFG